MITEDYVSFETAKLLKEKGFDELTYACFTTDGKDYYGYRAVGDDIMRPTLQMAVKWLREVHNILLVIDYIYEYTNTSYVYKIYRLGENGQPEREPIIGVMVRYRDYKLSHKDYATYEEAAEEGIKYCLENLI